MRRQLDKLLIACTAICVICTMAFVVIGAPTVLDTSNRTNDVAALAHENAKRTRETAHLAAETAHLAKEIQASRKDSVITTCRETNARHRNVIRALDREIARKAKTVTSARIRQMRSDRGGTVRLLSAILPVADCTQRAKRLVTPPPAP